MSAFNKMFGSSSSRGGRKVRGPYKQYGNKDELKKKMIELKSTVTDKTPIKWRKSNPKLAGSDAYYRYELFINAKTFEEFAAAQEKAESNGIEAKPWPDIEDGLRRGFVEIG